MDKIRKALGNQEEEEESLLSDIGDATTLSWSTRIKGFVICFGLGGLCSILGSALLFLGSTGLQMFAIFYTIGNVLSLSSTCFLMGPVKQLKKMFDPTRLIATILVVIFLALTLCAALWWNLTALAIVFCLCQFLSLCWYSLSYIPFARDAVRKAASSCV